MQIQNVGNYVRCYLLLLLASIAKQVVLDVAHTLLPVAAGFGCALAAGATFGCPCCARAVSGARRLVSKALGAGAADCGPSKRRRGRGARR